MQFRLLPLALCTLLVGCATYAPYPYPYYATTPATTVVTPSVDPATGAVVQSPQVVYTYPAYAYPYPYAYAPYYYDPFPFFVSGTFLFSNGGHRHHRFHHFSHNRTGVMGNTGATTGGGRTWGHRAGRR